MRSACALWLMFVLLAGSAPLIATSSASDGLPLAPPMLASTTYYVAENGSDTANDGLTPDHAFREIRKGLSVAVAGDMILVANGSYLGFDVNNRHGSPGSPITIRAPEHNATVMKTTDRADNRDTMFVTYSSHIVIDGLRTFNANRAGMRIDASDNITVRNVTAGNNTNWGIFTDFSDHVTIEDSTLFGSVNEHGIYFSNSGDWPVARNNTIYDNHGCGIHMNGDINTPGGPNFDGVISGALLENNTIFNNSVGGGGGINMDGVQNTTVRNNVIYDSHATGITNYMGDGGAGPTGNFFYHNTVDVASNGRYALQITQSQGPIKVRNNILYARSAIRGGLALGDATDVSNVDSDYNIMDRMSPDDWNTVLTLAQWQAQGHEPHSFSAHPTALFVDWANRDYHLSSNSSAIDKGENLTAVTWDKDGNPRPSLNASDIGAYEFVVPVPPDTTPPAAIIDLAAGNVTMTSVNLTWTAPGDDGMTGTAFGYDMRYNTSAVSELNWNESLKAVGVPAPLPAGTKQNHTVTGLMPGTTYHFAIKAKDKAGNTAVISNVVSATTLRPELWIGAVDIVFSNDTPMEGDVIWMNATVHTMNLTQNVSFCVEMRVDGVLKDNRTLSINVSAIMLQYNWTSVKGSHNIMVNLDTANAVAEVDETNNVATRELIVSEIPPPPVPDLFVGPGDIIFSDDAPFHGDNMTISVLVHAVNLTHNVSISVEMLVDDIVIGNMTAPINSSMTLVMFEWTAVFGQHTVTVNIDTANAVAEADETNNGADGGMSVGAPDLSVSESDIGIPLIEIVEGDDVDIAVTVHAMDMQQEFSVLVEILVDDGIMDIVTLVINSSENELHFLWMAAEGAHNITVNVDSTDDLLEANETNNNATRQVMVLPGPGVPVPDLHISSQDIMFSNLTPTEGDDLVITVSIGVAYLMPGTRFDVELLVDGVSQGTRETRYDIVMGATATFHWTAAKGAHNITVQVDPGNVITETDETNNVANVGINVAEKEEPSSNGGGGSDNAIWLYFGIAVAVIVAVLVVALVMMKRRRKERKEKEN